MYFLGLIVIEIIYQIINQKARKQQIRPSFRFLFSP